MKQYELKPIFVKENFNYRNLKNIKEGKIYIQEKQVIFWCPCGGEHLVILPINQESGVNWSFTNNNGLITMSPSILTNPCNSHYFIRDNKIICC